MASLELPDKVVMLIICKATNHIPVDQQLPAILKMRLVSTQWRRVIQHNAFTSASQVAISFGKGHMLQVQGAVNLWHGSQRVNFQLCARGNTRTHLYRFTVKLFPAVRDFSFDYPESWPKSTPKLLLCFLKYYRQLHKLTVTIRCEYNQEEHHQIWNHINVHQKVLRELILFVPPSYVFAVQLAVLNTVEYFSLTGYTGDIIAVLMQLGPDIRRLALDSKCSVDDFQFVVNMNPALSTYLTDFAFYEKLGKHGELLLKAVCCRLSYLHRLCFYSADDPQINLSTILFSISTLTYLSDLSLKLSPTQLYNFHMHPPQHKPTFLRVFNFELEINLFSLDVPFNKLIIEFENFLSYILFCLHPLYEIFPNVKRVQLELYSDMVEDWYEEAIERVFEKNFKFAEKCNVFMFNSSEV